MTRPDDPIELEVPDGWGFVTTVDRREFLKLTSTGLLVMLAIEPLLARQEPARLPAGRQGYPTDSQRVRAHRRRRPG